MNIGNNQILLISRVKEFLKNLEKSLNCFKIGEKWLTRYTVHGRGAKHWFTPSQILKSTPNRAPQILQFLNFFHPRNPRQKPLFKSYKKVRQKLIKSGTNPDLAFE